MRKLILPVLAFFLVAGTAAAAQVNTGINASIRTGGPAIMPAASVSANGSASANAGHPMPFNPGGPMRPASTTMMWHGSTTSGMMMRHGSSTMPMAFGTPGTVASIGSDSFTMTSFAERDHATTTLTVNVTASTTFDHASTTISFNNLSVGAHVLVLGKVSTSTKSVSAERVLVLGDMPMKPKGGIGGLIDRIKDFFTGNHVSASVTGAAAVQSNGFLGNVVHEIFGWL